MGLSANIHPAPAFDPGSAATEKFYGTLLKGTTHKLNNLLAVIHGFTSLLMMNDDLDEGDQDNLKHMKEAAQGATLLSDRILVAGGCTNATLQDVNTDEFISLLDSSVNEIFQSKGLTVSIHSTGNLPHLNTDLSRLKEILIELLNNAAEAAAPAHGKTELAFQPSGTYSDPDPNLIEITVKNEGPDIDPAKLDEIFEPFYSNKESQHFGVGLTVASVLASKINATLGVQSTNGTTTFILLVPTA